MKIKVGFGGGCHWCTEAVFLSLRDVCAVCQGYIRADPPHDSYSEAVDVVFDPAVISIGQLIRVHLATHSSTSDHKMRGKYRSAIYVPSKDHAETAYSALKHAAEETGLGFVTQVLLHRGFRSSDERFQNYQSKNADRPFCKTYIDPKLATLRREFGALLKTRKETE